MLSRIISVDANTSELPRAHACGITDEEVASGLAEIGAVGKSFDKKSFTHRVDKTAPYPDKQPEGTKVSIYVSLKKLFGITRTVETDDFLTNSSGKKLARTPSAEINQT